MTTLIFFLIQSLALTFYSYRLRMAQKKVDNPYLKYFYYGILVITAYQFIAFTLTAIYLSTSQLVVLYWLDVVSRFMLNLSAVFLIQMFCNFYFPRNKYKYMASYVLAFVSFAFLVLNLTLKYQPAMDAQGVVYWNSPLVMLVSSTVILSLGWFTASWIFFVDYLKGKQIKPLLIGLGTFFAGLGVVLQDYIQNSAFLNLLYLLMIIGATLILIGFVKKENKVKPKSV